MFPLLETIRLEDGHYRSLVYHEQRMRRALRDICHTDTDISLESLLRGHSRPESGLYRCRLLYDADSHLVEFAPYLARPVRSLRMIIDDTLSYAHKYCDRSALERHFDRRGDADDVLIIQNGMVTDTTYANIAFRKGSDWFTPSTCLLRGTMRQQLLDQGKVREDRISVKDVVNFESFRIINAMLMFDAPEVSVQHIEAY